MTAPRKHPRKPSIAYAPSQREREAAKPGPVVIAYSRRPAEAPELPLSGPEARHMREIAKEA